MLEDREGLKLAVALINYSAAKERKSIIKTIKDHVLEIINSEGSQAYVIIEKLIHSVDDTVLINKSLIKPILSDFESVIQTKSGLNVISSIFAPKHGTFHTFENADHAFTTR